MSYQYFNRNSSWTKAQTRNAATNFFKHGEIRLIESKAKKLRSYVEKIITLSKKGDLSSIRKIKTLIIKMHYDEKQDVLYHIVHDVSKKYKNRNGGYTRVIKLDRRRGDNSKMALLTLV